MINIAEKTKHIGLYVTETEFKHITENTYKYGFKTRADYIRSALEFFNERRYNAAKNNELTVIQDCIGLLEDHKKHVQNSMLHESLQELQDNIADNNERNNENLQANTDVPCKDLAGSQETTLQENDENLQAGYEIQKPTRLEPFENIIQTLIRLTHVKGKPSDTDFEYQAKRCGKSKKEVMDFYDDNYQKFVEESYKCQ